MPADPLTRLMMDADNVSVSAMDALMGRVSQALAQRLAGCGGLTVEAPRRPCAGPPMSCLSDAGRDHDI
jgi:hypothetical protein